MFAVLVSGANIHTATNTDFLDPFTLEIYNDFDDGQGLLDMRSLFNNPPPEDPHDSARPIPVQLDRDGIASGSEGETSSQQSVPADVDSGSPHAVVDSGSQPVVGTKSSQRPTIVDCEDKPEINSPNMVGPDVDAFHNMYQQAARSGPLSEGNLKRHQNVDLMNSQFHTRPLRVKARGKACPKPLKRQRTTLRGIFRRAYSFPGRESVHTAHYVNYKEFNKCCGLVYQVGILDAEPEPPQVSYRDLIDQVAPIERQIKWIESKEHSHPFNVQCLQRFMASPRHDQGFVSLKFDSRRAQTMINQSVDLAAQCWRCLLLWQQK